MTEVMPLIQGHSCTQLHRPATVHENVDSPEAPGRRRYPPETENITVRDRNLFLLSRRPCKNNRLLLYKGPDRGQLTKSSFTNPTGGMAWHLQGEPF
jgi:hypothetical protein